jgi:transposase
MIIFRVSRKTLYNWLTRWEKSGFVGLYNETRSSFNSYQRSQHSKLSEWEPKNLKLFWLPTYSPKQNLIEILWKFIKYEWIEVDAYANWSSLIKYLKKVLDNLGQEYVINFV